MTMNALIDPNGNIVQVEAVTFPVAPPFEWVPCPDTCDTTWTYDGTNFTAPPPVTPPPPKPDPIGFINAVKTDLGWPAAALTASQPLVNMVLIADSAIALSNWTDLQAIITAANTGTIITSTQYAAIKAAASTFNIPITLA